ncbi:MAG: ABC transporter substrate binding protein [Fusobacterium sp. JB021]|nr:ABC transporter substrate binding protein [Fusobacterium sp. JB021]
MLKKSLKIFNIMMFLFLFTLSYSNDLPKEKVSDKILFISSYSYDWISVPRQLKGFSENIDDCADIHYIFMDTKKFNYSDIKKDVDFQVEKQFKKFNDYKIIIAGDDNALDYVLDRKNKYFKDKGIIFLGINNINKGIKASKDPMITGVFEKLYYEETIALAKKVYPKATRVVAVIDDTKSSNGSKNQLIKSLENFKDLKINYIETSKLSRKEIGERLSSLNLGEDILIFLNFLEDLNGNSYCVEKASKFISENSSVPVFRTDTGIKFGLLGGQIINYEQMGEKASKMANKILQGENIKNIQVETCDPKLVINYEVYKKYNLKLPHHIRKEVNFINKPESFFKKYSNSIIYTLLLIIAIYSISLALIYYNNFKKQRKLTKKAKLKAEAKGNFLASTSHEIRTPMNSIIGATELIKLELKESKNKKIKEYLNIIENSSELLLKLINNVLDIAAIEKNKFKLSQDEFKGEEISTYIENMYLYQCEKKGIKLNINYINVIDEKLKGDIFRINQILLNLVGNAYKFTEKGGRIDLIISEEKLDNNKVKLKLIVKDTGCGMSEELKNRLFNKFEQETSSTVRKYGGSGLGLSITKSIVELMNGEIKVESKKNIGTSFTVELFLDISENKQEKLDTSFEKEYNFSGKKILLVEDNEINKMIMKKILENVGVEVKTAENGKVAYEEFIGAGDNYFDLILMDLKMPETDGYAGTKLIRNSNIGYSKKIKIYAMTADAFSETIKKCFETGMDGHIAKPISPKDLYELLQNML